MKPVKNLSFRYLIYICFTAFFLFRAGPIVYAQAPAFRIYGRVSDGSTSAPLENVNLIIVQTSQGSSTDGMGEFSISDVREGSYTVQASMTGYKTEKKKVTVTKDRSVEVNFILQPVTYLIDSVKIVAEKEFRSLMFKPYTEPLSIAPAISKVSHAEITRQGSITVVDAMNYVPGGLTETRGRQVKQFFSVRGQKYPYPNYALNGVWQQEFEELPYFFSASDIEEIEIVRTSAALLTGLSGMGGLINIKTREFLSPEADIELEYGSFNSLHSHLSAGSTIGKFNFSTGIGYDKTDGPEGKHAKEEMANVYTQVSWQPSRKLNVKANLFYLDGSRQLAKAEPPADKKYQDMLQSFDPYRALLSNVKIVYRPTEKLSSELQLFYTYRDPVFVDEVKSTTSSETDSEWGANFIQSVTLSKNNILRFGGLYNHWVAPNGKRFYTGTRCDTETISGVIVDEHRFGDLTIDAGVRVSAIYLNDYAAFNIEGEGSQFKNVIPIQDEWVPPVFQGNLGASYKINDKISLYFNSAAGQIRPRPGSLNEDLGELSNEFRYKADLGIVFRSENAGKLTFTLFDVLQKDAIALSGTTYTDTVTGEIRELYVNRDQNQSGAELEYRAPRLFNLIEPFINLTIMKSMLEEAGTMVKNSENPSLIAGGGLFLEKKGIGLNILCKYVSPFENERFAPPSAGPQPLGDFFTIDIKGGYTFRGKVPLNLFLRVQNLTNVKYSTVVGYPDFGRKIYGGILLKFIKND
jgi:iron complex outermembrane receptor protein